MNSIQIWCEIDSLGHASAVSSAVCHVDPLRARTAVFFNDYLLVLDLTDALQLAWNTQQLLGSGNGTRYTAALTELLWLHLTYRICSIPERQLSRCPGGIRHMSCWVFDSVREGTVVVDV